LTPETHTRIRRTVGFLASLLACVMTILSIANSPSRAVGEWRENRGYQMLSLSADGGAMYNGRACSWKAGHEVSRLVCGKRSYEMTIQYDRIVLLVGKHDDKDIEFRRAKMLLSRNY